MAAREHFSAENLGEFTVTSNTVWGSACTLSPTLANGVDYIVFWSIELTNTSNTSADAQARVTVGGTSVASFNVENRSTSEIGAYSGFFKVTGTGSAQTIALEIKAETNGNTIYAQNRRLTVLRMGAGDVYAESTARQAVTAGGTTNWADVLTASFTPDAGEYLVLAHSMTDNYATTTSVYGKFSFDGTAEGNLEVATAGHGEVGSGQKNLVPLNKQRVYSVATGGVSREVKWLGRSHQSGQEVGFQQSRLVVLKLADFAAYHSAWLPELGWVEGGATATDVLTMSPTVTANPHLLLGAWYATNVSSTTSVVSGVLDDSDSDDDAAMSSVRSYSTNDTRGQASSFAGLRTYSAGVRPIILKINAPSAEWIGILASSAFTLLDLGADETSVPVTVFPTVGALTSSGFAPNVIAGRASSVTASAGSVSITTFVPNIFAGRSSSVTVPAGSLSLTGYQPTVSAGQSAISSPNAGSVSISGLTPDISAAKSSTSFPATGALTVTGFTPTVLAARSATSTPDLGAILIAGFGPSIGSGQSASIIVGLGSLAITGQAPAARSAANLTPAAGSASLQGFTPAVLAAQGVTVSVGAATLSLTGHQPEASTAVKTSPLAGSLSLSGHEATVRASVALEPALTATLTVSGHASTIHGGARLQTLSASLLLTGFSPGIQAGGAVSIQPGSGSITLDGGVPTLSAEVDLDIAAPLTTVIAGHEPDVRGSARLAPANDNLGITGHQPEATGGVVTRPNLAELVIIGFAPEAMAGQAVSISVAPGEGLFTGLAPNIFAGRVAEIAPATGALSLFGWPAEVRITSGRPTLTRDRTYVVAVDQTICVIGRDQTTHVVGKDQTTHKAA